MSKKEIFKKIEVTMEKLQDRRLQKEIQYCFLAGDQNAVDVMPNEVGTEKYYALALASMAEIVIDRGNRQAIKWFDQMGIWN